MERVIQALQEGRNALLESPTGTGKTLCLLCATLAWHASHPENPVRIIYSSRTHSQLTQVVRELKATGYRPRITILGSREQLCVHPTVSKERGTAQNHMCRTMVKAQACSFYNNIHKFMTQNPALSTEQLDVEDLVDVGKEYYVCPYYLSRESQGQAQLMFMPYNYLIDPSIRATSAQELLHNSVIIFDEVTISFMFSVVLLIVQKVLIKLFSPGAQFGECMSGLGFLRTDCHGPRRQHRRGLASDSYANGAQSLAQTRY
jgi:regulator of telomere elongation helicase 1